MSFKIGLVGLCTSHPECWVPILRELTAEGKIDAQVVAVWDSAETRKTGFAAQFAAQFAIPATCATIAEMIPLVDGVIVHTTNWDKHIEQAAPFAAAGKAVYIDKPIAGNMRDIHTFLSWQARYGRITGGSVLRYCPEVVSFLARPESERGQVHTAYAAIGVDDFNYGIHAYAILSALLGPGVASARYLGSSSQKQIMLTWQNGAIALITVGKSPWLPFNVTAVTDKNVFQIGVDNTKIYRGMLETVMPWFTGVANAAEPPHGIDLVEPELAALAARTSWQENGKTIFISDLSPDTPGYNGAEFAAAYRRSRGL